MSTKAEVLLMFNYNLFTVWPTNFICITFYNIGITFVDTNNKINLV